MKKTVKTIIIWILALYFVLSIGDTILKKGFYQEELKVINSGLSMAGQAELEDYKISDLSRTNIETTLSLVNGNIFRLIISVLVGSMIGLIRSAKENSKIKYFLYFVFGGVIYNGIWSVVMMTLYNQNGIPMEYLENRFARIYLEMFVTTIWSYLFFYIATIVIHMLNNKRKVNKLNENLASERLEKKEIQKEQKRNGIMKKVKMIAILLVIGILLAFTIKIIRNTSILIHYSNAIIEMNHQENYHYQIQSYAPGTKEEKRQITDMYAKDGIYTTKLNNKMVLYEDTKQNEYFAVDQIHKAVHMYQNRPTNCKIKNAYFYDTYPGTWHSFLLAFKMKIDTKTEEEGKYYVLKYKQGNQNLYIDQKTYMPVKEELTGNRLENDEIERIEEYFFEVGGAKEEDIEKPDISMFEKIEK